MQKVSARKCEKGPRTPSVLPMKPASKYCPGFGSYNPRPVFDYVSSNFMPDFFCQNLERSGDKGCSYYFMPKPFDLSYSNHFNPNGVYFETFVGIYVLPVGNSRPFPQDENYFTNIAIRDMQVWSYAFGVPNWQEVWAPEKPVITCLNPLGAPFKSAVCKEWRIVQPLLLHLDVGDGKPRAPIPPIWGPAPKSDWSNRVDSYAFYYLEPVEVRAWYAGNYLFATYWMGAKYYDKMLERWVSIMEFPSFVNEMKDMTRSVRIAGNTSGAYSCVPSLAGMPDLKKKMLSKEEMRKRKERTLKEMDKRLKKKIDIQKKKM